MRRKTSLFVVPAIIIVGAVAWFAVGLPKPAAATGDAYFTIAPTSGTYSVGSTVTVNLAETSTAADNTNAVGVNLAFPSSLAWQTTTLTGPFTLCSQNTHSSSAVNIACAATTAQSGTQAIATITFTVLTGGANAAVGFTSGSDIDNTSGQSVWNGSLPGATYTLQSPAGTSAPTTTTKTTTSTVKTATPNPTPVPTKTPSPSATPSPTPSAVVAPATPGSVSVTVSDPKGRVDGATVTLAGQVMQTDASGVANFSGVQPGTYQVTVTAPGDKAFSATITLASGENKLVDYKLSKAVGLGMLPIIILVALVLLLAAGGAYYYVAVYLPAHLPATGAADQARPVIQPAMPQQPASPPTPTPGSGPDPQPPYN